jgi:hypothetical protein
MQCRADLMGKYATAEEEYAKSFQQYELDRVNKYLEIKVEKHEGRSKMTD